MRERGDDDGAQAKLRQAFELARTAGLPALARRIEVRLRRYVGDADALQASLNKDRMIQTVEERLKVLHGEAPARGLMIADDNETGLD